VKKASDYFSLRVETENLQDEVRAWWKAKQYDQLFDQGEGWTHLGIMIGPAGDQQWEFLPPMRHHDIFKDWEGGRKTVQLLSSKFGELLEEYPKLAHALASMTNYFSFGAFLWLAELANAHAIPMWRGGMYKSLAEDLSFLISYPGARTLTSPPELAPVCINTRERVIVFWQNPETKKFYDIGGIRMLFKAIGYTVKFASAT
jgi:hypothetical protein